MHAKDACMRKGAIRSCTKFGVRRHEGDGGLVGEQQEGKGFPTEELESDPSEPEQAEIGFLA